MPNDKENAHGTENSGNGKNQQSGGISTLIEETTAQQPTPNEEVIENLNRKARENNTNGTNTNETTDTGSVGNVGGNRVSQDVDTSGTVFNPSIHEYDTANNRPRKTVDGKFRRKRGGAAKKGDNASFGTSGEGGNASQESNTGIPTANQVPNVDYAGTAHVMLNTGFTVLGLFLGEHWLPQTNEYNAIHKETVRCLEFYGMPDVPPIVALGIVLGGYALPRYMDPRTQERLKSRKRKVPNETQSEVTKSA